MGQANWKRRSPSNCMSVEYLYVLSRPYNTITFFLWKDYSIIIPIHHLLFVMGLNKRFPHYLRLKKSILKNLVPLRHSTHRVERRHYLFHIQIYKPWSIKRFVIRGMLKSFNYLSILI